MARTHKVNLSLVTDAGTITSTIDTFTADSESNYDGSIPTATTNGEIDLTVPHSNIRSMVLYSDKALTLKTNSTSAPDDTIALAAGVQVMWNTKQLGACPITADVTKIYVTNASGAAAALKMYFLIDATPVLADPA